MRWLKVDYDKEYKAMRDIIHPPGGHTNKFSFLNEYRSMVSNTENWVKEQEDDEEIEHVFEEMVEWQSKFCVLRPINPNDSEEAMALVKTWRTILHSHDYEIMETDEIAALGVEGLVSCDCSTYLHYCWCYHACSTAFHRKIITSYPPNLDPRPQFEGSKKGRPAKAKKGVALGRV
jgi:hypothetical protein